VVSVSVSRSRSASYFGPRKANAPIRAPLLTPVTTSNFGRVPDFVQPTSTPEAYAAPSTPPDRARTSRRRGPASAAAFAVIVPARQSATGFATIG
jgi:hypothetical protein